MKEWKCEICGYIHEGEEAPEECPVCKAKKENFSVAEKEAKQWRCTVCGHIAEGVEVPEACPLCNALKEKIEALPDAGGGTVEKDKAAESEEAKPEPAKAAAAESVKASEPEPAKAVVTASPAVSKHWRCLVCGHVHEGEIPPVQCPICKAPASQFAELDAKGKPIKQNAKKDAAAATPVEKPGIIARILMGMHIHPILAHFPNGILPMVVLFMAGSVFLGHDFFVGASTLFSLVFVLVTMPLVLASGFLEWKKRYRGARTVLFATKIFCSVVAFICLIVLVAWPLVARYLFKQDIAPDAPDSPYRLIYFIISGVLLLAVAMAGHLGGRLVFKNRGR